MAKYVVEMENISKEFPGVKALDGVKLNLKEGEVLAFLGENGAGKSTLVKILSGIYKKDEGIIKIDGKEVDNMTPKRAEKLGIAIIHQELNMCSHLTVAENIFLGREICKGSLLSNHEMNQETKKILEQLRVDLDPKTKVGELPVSKQQMVEIAKALSTDARILIMDEPTSALSAAETKELFRIINQLKSEGRGIIYISHRLDELRYISDRVLILRDGQYVVEVDYGDTTIDEIVSYMVGREIKEKFPRVDCQVGEKIFQVKNLNAGPLVRDVSFELHEGEILGIAGLMGAGRTETTRAIFGIDNKVTGEIYLDGKEVDIKKPEDSIKAGIVLAPEDRKKDGLCVKLTVEENIALPNLDILGGKSGIVNLRKQKEMVDEAVKNLQIKLASSKTDANNLSGGNQQKVVVAKWLARQSRVVIFDEPTRGIDVGAKIEIYNLMNELKKNKTGVIFVSSEMPEILGISDRVLVMCDGRITGNMPIDEATGEKIMKCATHFEEKVGDSRV